MAANFEECKLPLENRIGMLIFDEMKIKEGLVWSAESNKLIAFTDIVTTDDENIASNIIQFFVKSVFSEVLHTCAYLAVNNFDWGTSPRCLLGRCVLIASLRLQCTAFNM